MARRGWRRWLRRLGLGLLLGISGLLALVVGLVALVIFTPVGTRWALRVAVGQYASAIPGRVSFAGSEGPLSDLCLHDVRLRDAGGRPLVTMDAVCLRVRLSSLLRRHVELERVTVVEPRVHLWPESTWSDLSPPGPEPPPTELPGPDLPVRVTGPVEVWGLAVLRHQEDGTTEALAREVGVRADVVAEGRRVHAHVAPLWGLVPPASASIVGGRAELVWHSPVVMVEELTLLTSLGTVERLVGHLDTRTMTYAASIEAEAWVPREGQAPLPVGVAVEAEGSEQQATAEAKVRAEGLGRATLSATASFVEGLALSAFVHADPAPEIARAPVHAWVTAVRPAEGTELRAHAFATAPGALVVAAWDGRRAQAQAWLPGAHARARARVEDGALRAVEGTAVVRSAEQATAALDRILPADVPRLEGQARVRARCTGPGSLRCRIEAAARREGDWLETRLGLELGPPLVIGLQGLRGRLRGQPVVLADPARVIVREGSATATPLHLLAAGGSITAAGRVVWSGGEPSDLQARLAGIDLSVISRLLPQVSVRGRLDAALSLQGVPRRPTIDAAIVARNLAWDGEALGDLRLDAGYDDRSAHADLRWRVGGSRARAVAELPVVLDLQAGAVRLREQATMAIGVDVEQLELRRLARWIDGPPLRGEAEAIVRATGSIAAPRVELEVLARRLRVGEHRVGTVRLEATSDDGRTHAEASLQGRALGQASVEATVPLAVVPTRGGVRYRPQGLHQLQARLQRLDVGELMAVAGELANGPDDPTPVEGVVEGQVRATVEGEAIEGRVRLSVDALRLPGQGVAAREVELSAELDGTRRAPLLAALLEAEGLRSRGQPLGRARLYARYEDRALRAELEQTRGAESIAIAARVPLEVDLLGPRVRWRRHEDHRLSLRAEGVTDDAVRAAVGLPQGLAFTAAARLEAHGSIDDPRLLARVRASVASDGLDVPVAALVELEPRQQHARVLLGTRGNQSLTVEARARALLPRLLQGQAELGATPIEVEARALELALQELAPMVPEAIYDPQGRLELQASITGTIDEPQARGAVQLRDAALTVVPLNQRFTGIELWATLDGPALVVRRLTARSGQGRISAQAALHLEPQDTRGRARVTVAKLPIVRPGLPMMQLQARVDAELDARGTTTAVDLTVHDAVVDLVELGPIADAKPIPRSEGVVFVDAAGTRERRAAEQTGADPWLPQAVALTVTLAEPLEVRGAAADMAWTGHVELLNPPQAPPTATGAFRLDGGRVSLFGNDFDIQRAELRFPETGDLDPFIDLVATVDTAVAQITMIVRGRASRPSLTLRSDPPMSQSDILAVLITGSADASRADDQSVSAKAAGLLAAVSNPELYRYVQSTIGLDRIGVGFGETLEEPIVTVGKRLSKKVYVEAEYHHNAPEGQNDAEVRIEYRFAPPQWLLETWFGNAAQGGVAVWWRRRFRSLAQRRQREAQAKREESARREEPAKRDDRPRRQPPSPRASAGSHRAPR